MIAEINRDGCIACGVCASICPEVFRMGSDGLAKTYVEIIPSEVESSAVGAMDSCPVSVINIE